MKLDTAVIAGRLAANVARIESLLAAIDTAIRENWPVSALRGAAPAKGASQPAGTEIDLLAAIGVPIADLWKIALTTARDQHQAALADLTAQLEAL